MKNFIRPYWQSNANALEPSDAIYFHGQAGRYYTEMRAVEMENAIRKDLLPFSDLRTHYGTINITPDLRGFRGWKPPIPLAFNF